MSNRILEQDYYDLAEKRGFIWVGEFPKTAKSKTAWQCQNGHKWSSCFTNIKSGRGCPYCYGNVKKTEEDYFVLAKKIGYAWIGRDLPKNTHANTRWLCNNEHMISVSYDNLLKRNVCAICSGKARKTKRDYHFLASKRKFKWIGRLPSNAGINTQWKCQKNHTWLATYDNVNHGTGCPACVNMVNGAKASKIQIKIAQMTGGIVNHKVGRKSIDVAFPDELIGIEYDCKYWHEDREQQDQARIQELLDQGWRMISVKANKQTPTFDQIATAVLELANKPHVEIILDWK